MKILAVIAMTLAVAFSSFANAQSFFKANINGAQANQGNGTGSAATGNAVLILNDAMDELTMTISFTGITTANLTAFHIHNGDAGVNGPVIFGLLSPNHDQDGDFMDLGDGFISGWDGTEGAQTLSSQLTDLQNEGLYFNAHTPAFPGGEIRGQIVPLVLGDVNLDGTVNLLDVSPFVDRVTGGQFQAEADINFDGVVGLLDVAPFVALLSP